MPLTPRDNKACIVNVDFDGVIANLVGAMIVLRGGGIRFEEVDRWDHPWIFSGSGGHTLDGDLHNPRLYEYLRPYVHVDRALEGLMDSGYTVHITSSRHPDLKEGTVNWLKEWGIPFHQLRFVDSLKHEVGPHILVEDHRRVALDYTDRGPAIIFKQPWNQSAVERERYSRRVGSYPVEEVSNWQGVVEAVRRLVNVQELVGRA